MFKFEFKFILKYEFNFNYLPLVFDWMNYHTDSKYRAGAS